MKEVLLGLDSDNKGWNLIKYFIKHSKLILTMDKFSEVLKTENYCESLISSTNQKAQEELVDFKKKLQERKESIKEELKRNYEIELTNRISKLEEDFEKKSEEIKNSSSNLLDKPNPDEISEKIVNKLLENV